MLKPETVGLPKDLGTDFFKAYDTHCRPRLGGRSETFRAIFELLDGKPASIVETGSLRIPNNWAGDGQSTFLFDMYVNMCGGEVDTVDLYPEVTEITKMVISDKVEVHTMDSVKFLNRYGSYSIDLLYLDSYDYSPGRELESSLHHLYELFAAKRWLGPGTIVAVDDVIQQNGQVTGKARFISELMEKLEIPLLVDGYQRAWRIE